MMEDDAASEHEMPTPQVPLRQWVPVMAAALLPLCVLRLAPARRTKREGGV